MEPPRTLEEDLFLMALVERLERIEAKLDRLLTQHTYTVTLDQIQAQVRRHGLKTRMG